MGGAYVTGRQPVGNLSSSRGINGSTGLLLRRWIGRWVGGVFRVTGEKPSISQKQSRQIIQLLHAISQ
jgi:hypothetical protein